MSKHDAPERSLSGKDITTDFVMDLASVADDCELDYGDPVGETLRLLVQQRDALRAQLEAARQVKPLPRSNGKIPWELDWSYLDSLHKEACSYEDGMATHVAVEAIALAVERRILSALTDQPEGE